MKSAPRVRNGQNGPQSGSAKVYSSLRHRILTLQLAPGAELEEAFLADTYGVSRTPVREALIRLSADQLVQILPNRGAIVAPLTLTDFPRFIECQSLVESTINAFAAVRRTEACVEAISATCAKFEEAVEAGEALAMTDANLAFHRSIANAASNPQLAAIYMINLAEGARLARVSFAYGGNNATFNLKPVIEDHRSLLYAIVAKDADQAARLGRNHAALFQRRIVQFLSENQLGELSGQAHESASSWKVR